MKCRTRIASIAIAGLTAALPAFAQTPDARAGAVVVETQKPKPRTAPIPADGTIQPVIVVGDRHGARPPKRPGAGPASPGNTGPPRRTRAPDL